MVPLSEPQEAPASRGFALADVLLPAGMPLELQCVGSDRHGATALASATVGVFATSKKTPGMLDDADAAVADAASRNGSGFPALRLLAGATLRLSNAAERLRAVTTLRAAFTLGATGIAATAVAPMLASVTGGLQATARTTSEDALVLAKELLQAMVATGSEEGISEQTREATLLEIGTTLGNVLRMCDVAAAGGAAPAWAAALAANVSDFMGSLAAAALQGHSVGRTFLLRHNAVTMRAARHDAAALADRELAAPGGAAFTLGTAVVAAATAAAAAVPVASADGRRRRLQDPNAQMLDVMVVTYTGGTSLLSASAGGGAQIATPLAEIALLDATGRRLKLDSSGTWAVEVLLSLSLPVQVAREQAPGASCASATAQQCAERLSAANASLAAQLAQCTELELTLESGLLRPAAVHECSETAQALEAALNATREQCDAVGGVPHCHGRGRCPLAGSADCICEGPFTGATCTTQLFCEALGGGECIAVSATSDASKLRCECSRPALIGGFANESTTVEPEAAAAAAKPLAELMIEGGFVGTGSLPALRLHTWGNMLAHPPASVSISAAVLLGVLVLLLLCVWRRDAARLHDAAMPAWCDRILDPIPPGILASHVISSRSHQVRGGPRA